MSGKHAKADFTRPDYAGFVMQRGKNTRLSHPAGNNLSPRGDSQQLDNTFAARLDTYDNYFCSYPRRRRCRRLRRRRRNFRPTRVERHRGASQQ